MPSVVAVEGGLTLDHLVTEGAGARFSVPGGPGLYACLGAAAALRRHQGVRVTVRLLWPLPSDAHSTTELLDHAQVDLTRCPDGPELPRLWILDSAQGRRVLPTATPVRGHELSEDDENQDQPWQPARTDLDDVEVLLRCAPDRPAADVPERTIVVIDPDQRVVASGGMDAMVALARGAHVLCPSRVQLSLVGTDPRQAALAVREHTGCAVVARLDADGCLVLPSGGGIWRVWHERAVVVDTTGAGDSHAGALAASLATSRTTSTRHDYLPSADLLEAARIATATANCTVSAWGPDGLCDTPSLEYVHTEEIA